MKKYVIYQFEVTEGFNENGRITKQVECLPFTIYSELKGKKFRGWVENKKGTMLIRAYFNPTEKVVELEEIV